MLAYAIHLPKPRRLTAEPRSRALRVALTLTVSISSKRWKSSRAMSQPGNFHPQSSPWVKLSETLV